MTLLPVRVGQVWASPATGNRFQVVSLRSPYVTVEALDGGRFEGQHVGDNCYGFHERAFADGTMQFSHAENWTREELAALRHWERPRVRVRYGNGDSWEELTGGITPDGGKVWVEIPRPCSPSTVTADTFSWSLVLEVLNDPHAAPLWIEKE